MTRAEATNTLAYFCLIIWKKLFFGTNFHFFHMTLFYKEVIIFTYKHYENRSDKHSSLFPQ